MKTDYYVHFKIVILLILSFFVLISNTQAATYYFSSSEGNDSRTAAQAQNESTPWKSIEKLNKVFLSISPGDRILFKRGDSFYGTIHITRSGTISAPITFGAYGDGDKPIITSLEEVNEWISVGNGIYESKDKFSNIEKINVLTIDNTLFSLGRFPNFDEENKGYLNITSTPNNNTILSTDLNGSLDWSGGEIVIRKNPWIIDRHFINSSSGSIINFQQTNSHYTASKNYGFFVQNHINTLDRFGEWCYDKKTEKIMIYFGHEIPSNHKIHISKLPYLMHFDWEEGNIIVTELDFRGANNSGIKIQGGINVKILKSNISFMAENAVEGILSHNLEISDCDINYSLNNGIYIENSTKNIVIKSNKISNTFTFNGMGKSSDLNGQAIYTTNDSHNGLIEKNRIYNTGYNAINFGGNNTIVKNNFIDNFCMHKSDGGGIYTWEGPGNLNKTGRSIENNIIINGIGYKEGTPYFNTINPTPIEGIYLDDNSSGIEIKNNSTANISNSGVYFHNARNIVFQKNLMFNCYQSVLLSHDEHGQEVRNVNIKNNIFLNPIPNNNFVKIFSIKEDFELMGEFDKNHYVNPLGNDFGFLQEFMFTNLNIQSKLMNLFWWNRDKNGKISPVNYNFSLNHEKLNENLFQNESFKNHVQKTYCNNNCNRNWSQSGYFKDGHVLINSSLNSQFTLETGKLAENSYYILRFSAKSNKDGFISIEINENGTPWRKLSKEQGFKISKDTQEFEFIFQSKIEAKSTLVTFKSNLEDFTYALDDVEFYEAEVNFRRHEDYVFFQYNDSNSSQKYPINGAYVDAYNNPFSGSVEIPPFSSVALIKVGDEKIQESIPPSISLITPKIDQEINLGDSLEIEVEASIGSAEIEKIEILVNNSSIKTFLKEPSIFKHFFEAIGTYMLQARIIDINGEESYSELISIKVNKELSAPQINWISPSDGDFFFAETPIQLAVSLIDDDISIEKVDFLVNNSIVGSTQNTPFQIAIPNLPVGKHNLQAIALSSDGIEGKSEVISINVTLPENTTPTITITAPSDNDQFFVGDPINIAANAVDADGSITKVEFFAGNNLLTTDTQAPFAFVWNDAPLGNHVISARTTDDNASTASSTEINILVTERPNNSPEITITAPSDNDQFFVGDPINIAANAVDADGSITKVEFFAGNNLLATDTQAPFAFVWNDAPLGNHVISARTTDDNGSTASSTEINILVIERPNNSPEITITAPSDNDQFFVGDPINIAANAVDADGSITKVEFFAGNNLLATDTQAPFAFVWNDAPLGNHVISARTTDDNGSTASSTEINILVIERPNNSPEITITAPSDNDQFFVGDPINIAANAVDADGSITKVEFFAGNYLLATDTQAPFAFVWNDAPLGNHVISARTTDDNGSTASSTEINILVIERPNNAPTVNITAPLTNTKFNKGDEIVIEVNAQDTDGTIAKVEFFYGNMFLGSDLTAPYSFNWTNAPAGKHIITAKAIDNKSVAINSSPISIEVIEHQRSPSVRIVSPIANNEYFKNDILPLNVEIPEESSEIIKVDYFRNNIFIGSRSGENLSYNWEISVTGSVNITAIATDIEGKTASDARSIRVVDRPNQLPSVQITSPSDDSTFSPDEQITIVADASDNDGHVVMVEFFQGNLLIGKSEASPYRINWNNPPLGNFSISARATDDKGGKTFSAPINILVKEDNSLPKIELLTPIDNQSFEFDETVELIAMFKGDAKNVKMVEYYANSELIASSSLAPFSSKWENTRPGTYNITAKAIGNIPTNFEVSEISRITVKNEPVFRIISPTQLSEHQKGSALSIEVETPTSTKTIDKVEFYNGNKLIGTSKDQPYSFVFENVPLGETTLISRLVYTDGTALFSFPVRIIGKNKPVVKIEASNGKTSFAVGDSVLIKPEFVDFQNPISQVEYFINGISKGIYKTSPFAHSLENMPHGEHEIWIEAIDDEGNKYVSEKLFINVSEIAREGEINLVDFKIGPNPTNRFLNLIFDNIQEEHHISAAVVSMNGSTVRVFDFVLNENEVTLDLEGLTAGTYLLRIQYQGKIIITKRFIKVN